MKQVIAALIEVLDDRDGAVRCRSYKTLGYCVSYLDRRLQGDKTKGRSSFPREVVRIPELPINWVNLATCDWDKAHDTKLKWQQWLKSLPDYPPN